MMRIKKRLEQEGNGQHVQDMSLRLADGPEKGHIDHRHAGQKQESQEKSGVQHKRQTTSLTKDGGREIGYTKGGKKAETSHLGHLVTRWVVSQSLVLKRAVMLNIVHTWAIPFLNE